LALPKQTAMRKNANGIEVTYERSGKPEGEVVMLSHSLGSSLAMWNPQMDELNASFHTLRYDTCGHGGTEVVDGRYTLDQLGDDAVGLMDALGVETVHWVGLSMGGMIGQNLALRYPDRMQTLSLCDTTSIIPDEAQPIWAERMGLAQQEGMEALADSTMQRWFTAAYLDLGPTSVQMIRDQFVNTAVAGFVGCCHAIRALDYLDKLSQIEIPTAIVVGADDPSTPVGASEAMHQRIRGSSFAVIPNAAHLANLEQAARFKGILLDFLTAH